MFEEYESKLGSHLQKLKDIPIDRAIDTTVEFATERGRGRYGQPASITDSKTKENIRKIADVFSKYINIDSFEHIVSLGDIGNGLFSFGTYIKDSNVGLYLCYREYSGIFGICHGYELYLGVYAIPADYDNIVKEGVVDMISAKGESFDRVFRLHPISNLAVSDAIVDLYEELIGIGEDDWRATIIEFKFK